ncbi:hypothetical protein ACTGXS_11075, partial [Streptococcus suis]
MTTGVATTYGASGHIVSTDKVDRQSGGGFAEQITHFDATGNQSSVDTLSYNASGVLQTASTTYDHQGMMSQTITRQADGSYTGTFVDPT